jgi:hypothetical protein
MAGGAFVFAFEHDFSTRSSGLVVTLSVRVPSRNILFQFEIPQPERLNTKIQQPLFSFVP